MGFEKVHQHIHLLGCFAARNKQSGNPSVMATWRQTSTCLVSTNSSSYKAVCLVVAALRQGVKPLKSGGEKPEGHFGRNRFPVILFQGFEGGKPFELKGNPLS